MTMEKFFSKWNGIPIDDWGAYMSDEAKSFFREMKNALKKELAQYGIDIVDFSVGHYYCSGFAEKDGKYVYFSYSITRGLPNNLHRTDASQGFLYRTAEGLTDYHGGSNHFCNWLSLPESIAECMKRGW